MSIFRIARSSKDDNPFYYKGIEIPEPYFCDRKEETDKMINMVRGGNNIVLKAPRRLGKSSLIHHVFMQEPLKKEYNTIYLDIYPTRNSEDFVSLLYRAITKCETISDKSGLTELEKRLKDISFSVEFNIPKILKVSKTNTYEILKIEKSLDIIFEFLSGTKRKNLVVIDEFQQIRQYKDCDLESSLRTFIQKAANTSFIFSGSARHLLMQIFESPDKPFYRSCRSMTLDIIPRGTYFNFCRKQFEDKEKGIAPDAINLVYDLFCGNTFMMQQAMNEIFQQTRGKETASVDDVKLAVEAIVDEKAEDYRTYLHGLKPSYEQVLLCIAKEGIASNLHSEEKRKEYDLPASTTISNILNYFQNDDNRVVEELSPNIYRLEDKTFELWAAKYIFENLDSKFDNASGLFAEELKLKRRISLSPKSQNLIR